MRVFVCVFAIVLAMTGFAAEPTGYARFSISGSGSKINLTSGTASSGGSVENISWGNESERKQGLLVEIPLTTGWNEFSFSFTPDKDGTVQLDLLGQDKNDADNKRIPVYTFYDDITATGAELKNGDFESSGEGNLAGWYFWNPDAAHPARIVCDTSAHGGKYFAAAWYQGHIVQHIKVAADKVVTLRGFALPAGEWTGVKTSAAKANVPVQEKVAAVKPDAVAAGKGGLTITAGKDWKALPDTALAVKPGTALDFSARLDHAPAGSRGRVIARPDGTLAFANEPDKPVRFFVHSGYGQGPGHPVMPLEQIEPFADAIMRQGYNMVRFHFLDQYLANQIAYWGKTLSPEAQLEFDRRLEAGEPFFKQEHLEFIDRLVAALKKRGIYLYLDAQSSWTGYYPANCWYSNNGVKDMNLFNNPVARRHYHNAVKQLLTHINPYTKTSFATDPQVAIILGNNEPHTGLESYINPAKWAGSSYLLLWRAFLRSRFADINAYHAAWHSQGPKAASIDEVQFFTQKDFWDTARGRIIQEFINKMDEETAGWQENELRLSGYQGLFSQYDWLNQLRLYLARAKVGVISMHGYFAHPGETGGKASIIHSSALGETLNWWRGIATTRISGMPLAVMEYGHVYWNRYRYEEGLSVGAYGSFQDMSALTTHASPVELVPRLAGPFKVGDDPVGRASQVVTGILFMDKTVKTAPHRVDIPLSRELALSRGEMAVSGDQTRIGLVTGLATEVEGKKSSIPASLRLPLGDGAKTVDSQFWSSVIDSESGTFAGALAQLRKAGIIPADNRTDLVKKIYESETKEILLDAGNKRLTVNTPLVVGTCGDKWGVPVTIGPLSIESSSVPASITLASRDGRKLEQSSRLLLVIATDARNSGASYGDAEGAVQLNAGKLPLLLRTGSFVIRIARGPEAPTLRAWALALDGTRQEELKIQNPAGGIRLDIDTGAWNKGPSPFIELSEKD